VNFNRQKRKVLCVDSLDLLTRTNRIAIITLYKDMKRAHILSEPQSL